MYRSLKFAILIALIMPGGAHSQDLKIGLITPLTGPRASIGQDASRGVELALEQLEAAAGAAKFGVQIEDSQGDPAKGVAAYKKFLAEGIRFILTQNSNVSLAIAPMVNHDGVIQLAITTTSERYSTPNDNTFRVNGPTQPEAELVVSSIADRLAAGKKVGLVTIQDEYPVTLAKYVQAGFKLRGIDLVAHDALSSETDYRALISKLARSKVGAVVFLGYQTQAGSFVKQFREMGSPAPVLLTTTPVNNREFFTIAGDASNGVFLTYPSIDRGHPAAAAFEREFGVQPNFFSANAYDAILIADTALKACGYKNDPECLKRSLFAQDTINGLSGKKRFDSVNGDMQDSYELLQAAQGIFSAPK